MTHLDPAGSTNVVLMADPRVTAIQVVDNGEVLVDVRNSGLPVSSYRADSTGAFAHVRAEVMDRLLRAADALPAGLRLLIIEGYRPPSLQRQYFDA